MYGHDEANDGTLTARLAQSEPGMGVRGLRTIAARLGSSWNLTRVRRNERREVRRWLATNPPSRGRRTGARC